MSTRPSLLRCVQLPTALLISCEFGRITLWRWNVSISVARTLIFLTVPETSPATIQSPALNGRSASRIRPETKFETMFCRPKPMPSDRPPATSAKFERSMPADEMRDQAGERQAGIADDGADRVAHAGVDAAARHDRAVEPALEPAREEIADRRRRRCR